MKKLLIFGNNAVSELAWFYFSTDSDYEVMGFSMTADYMTTNNMVFHDLPIIPFENIEHSYTPNEYDFFVPMGHKNMNKNREKFYSLVKEKGYKCATYISSQARIFQKENVGENCFILEGSVVQPFVHIGNNTIIWNGHIGHHSRIGNHVFCAKANLCGHTIVEDNCFIGTGASIAECRTIKKRTFIAMDSSVITDTYEDSYYAGVPAVLQRQKSYELREDVYVKRSKKLN